MAPKQGEEYEDLREPAMFQIEQVFLPRLQQR
jgi:hypothetical protein